MPFCLFGLALTQLQTQHLIQPTSGIASLRVHKQAGPIGHLSDAALRQLLTDAKAVVPNAINGKITLTMNHPLEVGKVGLATGGLSFFDPADGYWAIGDVGTDSGYLTIAFAKPITTGRYMIVVNGNSMGGNTSFHIQTPMGSSDVKCPQGGFSLPIMTTVIGSNEGYVVMTATTSNTANVIGTVEIYPIGN